MPEGYCHVHRLGRIPFETAWNLQSRVAAEIATGQRPPTLLLLEHPHTYTFGRRGQAANLLWDEDELAHRGVEVHWTDRGGDVTYHGPGQLVGYPLLPLGRIDHNPTTEQSGESQRLPQADFLGYLRRLERLLIAALSQFGLPAVQAPGMTGVWIRPAPALRNLPSSGAKIAALGVKVDARGLSRHGFALNVNPDMTYWDGIIGCGLEGYQVTSMTKCLGYSPDMTAVMEAVTQAFGIEFDYQMMVGKALVH